MSIFNKRLKPEQIKEVEDFYRMLQEDPNRFTQEEKNNINYLYNRTKESERFGIKGDTLMGEVTKGKITPEDAIRHRMQVEEQYPTGKGRTKKLYKSLPFEKNIPGDPFTNPDTILKQKEEEDRIQKEFELKRQEIAQKRAEKYTTILGLNPYEQEQEAFTQYFNSIKDNDEVMEQVIKDSKSKFSADIGRYLNKKFQESLNNGTLENMPGIKEQIKADEDERKKIEKMEQKELERKTKEEANIPILPKTGMEYYSSILQKAQEKAGKYKSQSIKDREAKRYLKEASSYTDAAQGFDARGMRDVILAYDKNPTEENKNALNEYYNTLTNVKISKGEDVVTFVDALIKSGKTPEDLLIYVKDIKDSKIYYDMWNIINKHKQGKELTEEEIKKVEQFEEQELKARTDGARIVEGIAQVAPFMQEFIASRYLLDKLGKLGIKGLSRAKKISIFNSITKEQKEFVKDYLKKRSIQLGITGAKTAVQVGGLTATKYAVGPEHYRQLIRSGNLQIDDSGELIYDEFIGDDTARKRAYSNLGIEYLSETMGASFMKAATFAGNISSKAVVKTFNALPKGSQILAHNEALVNSLMKTIKKYIPKVKTDTEVMNKLRQFSLNAGYHGFKEEWAEERIGEGMRAFLANLGESGIIEGFDEDFAEGVFTDLKKTGDWEQFARDFYVELAVLSAFPVARTGVAKSIEASKESAFRDKNQNLIKQINEAESIDSETKEQYNEINTKIEEQGDDALTEKKKNRIVTLSNKEKLSDKETSELNNLNNEKRSLGFLSLQDNERETFTNYTENFNELTTLNEVKNIIVDNPEISETVDLSEINLKEEMLKTEEELIGILGEKALPGEGAVAGAEQYQILGYTTAANVITG